MKKKGKPLKKKRGGRKGERGREKQERARLGRKVKAGPGSRRCSPFW